MSDECRTREVRVSIPSCLEWLVVIDKVAEGIAEELDLSEKVSNALAISVVEAGTNAIQHGNRFAEELPVEFSFQLIEDAIRVEVRDRGPGFDVDRVLNWDPTTPAGLMATRGRGIYIMKQLMDEVSFKIQEGEGCCATLIKRLEPAR